MEYQTEGGSRGSAAGEGNGWCQGKEDKRHEGRVPRGGEKVGAIEKEGEGTTGNEGERVSWNRERMGAMGEERQVISRGSREEET